MSGARIGLLLDDLPEIRALNGMLRQMKAVQHAVDQALPANLLGAVHVTQIKNGQATLTAIDGAIATKLAQLVPKIQKLLREQRFEITGIRVQVQLSMRYNSLPQKQISLSGSGSRAIRALAQKLPPSPLKNALDRLGSRAPEDTLYGDDGQPLQRH